MGDEPNDKTEGVDEQDLVDRDKIDFDPDDGLYAGTAVDGTTDIPGPHEGEDGGSGDAGDAGDAGENSDSDSDSEG